jgi:protein-tyrosine phosphatase
MNPAQGPGDSDPLVTELPYGLPGRIVRSVMPFSDFDRAAEVWPAYQKLNIGTVVVLAGAEECWERSGRDLVQFYRNQGLKVIPVPIPDHGPPPDPQGLAAAVHKTLDAARQGSNVAIHCYAGIGRTGIFAALLARESLGLKAEEAIAWVRSRIPGALETPGQQKFVMSLDPPAGSSGPE